MKTGCIRHITSLLSLLTTILPFFAVHAATQLVYIGTYTGPRSQGIYVSKLDLGAGTLSKPEVAAETPSPSFLAIHPNHRTLYAVSEINDFNGKKAGAVGAFSIDATTGKLTLLNKESAGGTGPCHVNIDSTGRIVTAANYGGGSIVSYPVLADGRLGASGSFIQHTGSSVDPKRQKEPHAHSVNFSKDDRFAFAADLGLDKVLIYDVDPVKGSLKPHDPAFATVPPGSGPRHLAFTPSGKNVYVINEMACTVTAFSYDAKKGAMTELQNISTLPPSESVKPAYSCAEVQTHPSGKFVYGSNRGHDTIAVFSVDAASGKLTYVENVSTRGKVPRGFGIDPTGSYLLAGNQNTHNVVVFRIDQKTGKLTPTGSSIEVGSPVCVKFLPLK